MTLKSMLLFRAAMTKRGEQGTLTGRRRDVPFEPVKLDKKSRS